MKYLLDTCVVSELVRPVPAKVVTDWILGQAESNFYLSVLTIGEILKGIAKVQDEKKKSRLQTWVDEDVSRRFAGRILKIDHSVASRWGALSGQAEREGRKVPVIDGLLAATALEAGLVLATRDAGHMEGTGVAIFDPWAL